MPLTTAASSCLNTFNSVLFCFIVFFFSFFLMIVSSQNLVLVLVLMNDVVTMLTLFSMFAN